MKRFAAVVLTAATLFLGSGAARALDPVEDEYQDSITHPLRVAGYLAHVGGFAAEWLIGRPFHYVISRPYLDRIFGYSKSGDESIAAYYGDRL